MNGETMSNLIFKHFCAEGGCNSFILGDAHSKKVCVIDPRADEMHQYEAFLTEKGLSVALVLDTHTHADHYSGTHLVAQQFGAPIAMSAATQSARASLRLNDGQIVDVGDRLGLAVIATPGHTPDSLSFVVSHDWGSAVFTGDTLLIGGSGRTDFPGADAAKQYESIYQRLGALDAATWVLPGHDYSGLLFSTIAHEKNTNPHWLFKTPEEFVRAKEDEILASGGILKQIVDFNLNAKPLTRPRSGAHTMCSTSCVDTGLVGSRLLPDSFRQLLEDASNSKDSLFIDVREPQEFKQRRVLGLCNIPLSELLLHWDELRSAKHVYFFCQEGKRSLVAAQSLSHLGLKNVSDLHGGLLAWIAAGYPVER